MKAINVLIIFLLIFTKVIAQGKVYLVLGSDTGIWSGASTSTLHCYYHQDLYTDPAANTYAVMDQTFRESIRGSDNLPIKLTWWMHGGNMFRHARNNNVPYSNTIALHLMKAYHQDAIESYGDEVTLHYHTWNWTDYDGDGIYYWNQTPTFNECREDFDWTLAQYLLEEGIFPVSFRSGWHYMDNDWQNYLDELLPFSLHNDYPKKHIDTVEPLDNLYDWSRCSPYFEPFHPSHEDYQLAGDARGWNVRSIYMKQLTTEILAQIFQRARDGYDQVVCVWSHLPEADFVEQIRNVHDRVVTVQAQFSDIDFYYYTAVEAMQAWLKTEDLKKPMLELTDEIASNSVKITIRTDEPIFQKQPFIAVKDIYKRYMIMDCINTGLNRWESAIPLNPLQVAKVGVAVADTVGNQSLGIIRYLPEDIFIDNGSEGIRPVTDNYSIVTTSAWGTDALRFMLPAADSAVAAVDVNVPENRRYRLFTQFAPVSTPVDSFDFMLLRDGAPYVQRTLAGKGESRRWIYLTTVSLDPGSNYVLYLKSLNTASGIRYFSPDGIKISAMIPERLLIAEPAALNFGTVSIFDTAEVTLRLSNHGEQPLTISDLKLNSGDFSFSKKLPYSIDPYQTDDIILSFTTERIAILEDTLWIYSNDPLEPVKRIPISVKATEYFEIIDNEDEDKYVEYGEWQTSVAQAYGPSSRFVYLSNGAGRYAEFTTPLVISGIYELFEIVPTTVNSTDNALYEISIDGVPIDSVYLDQNSNSGTWCTIGRYYLPAGIPVQVRVVTTGSYTAGVVLRADALKIQLIQEISDIAAEKKGNLPQTTRLLQNYPNPFNPATTIRYRIGKPSDVLVEIMDVAGRKVRLLQNGDLLPGEYETVWDGRDDNGRPVASGLYLCCLRTIDANDARKLVLIR